MIKRNPFYIPSQLLLAIIVGAISVYQKTLSPDHGVMKIFFSKGVCVYYPTCSQYTKESLLKYGWAGLTLGLRRVLRCHPWAQGGHDPVPNKIKAV